MSTQLVITSDDKSSCKQTICPCENDDGDVCEETLDKFVHRILLSATMNDKDGDKFGIADVDDGKLAPLDYRNKPKINGVRLQERYEKARKNVNRKKETKKSKWQKGKVDDMPRGAVQKVDGNSYVNVPLEVYRRMVDAEIDAKMKQVQEYQDFYLKKQDDIRLKALREVFYWKEFSKSAQANLKIVYNDLQMSQEALAFTTKQLQMYESYVPNITDKRFEPWKVRTAISEVRKYASKSGNQKTRKGSKKQSVAKPTDGELSESAYPATVHPPETNSKSDSDKISKIRTSASASELGAGNIRTKTSKKRRNRILRGLAKDTDDLPKTT